MKLAIRTVSLSLALLLMVMALGLDGILADDWPQWLGPQRDGEWRESEIVDRFPDGGPKRLWRQELGAGYSGPAVFGDRVFVMDRIRRPDDLEEIARLRREFPPARNHHYERGISLGSERLVCLDADDGKILWTHEYDCPYTTAVEYATGPRVTPTVDGPRVFALGAEGHLFALEVKSGKRIWSKDLKKDYGLVVPTWGCSASPLIDGEKLITVVGGKGTTVVAFDKKTGVEIWRSLSSEDPGYAAPVIHDGSSGRQLLIWHGEALNGLNPETGALYWSIPVKTWSGMAIATPRTSGAHLFVTGFPEQSTLIRLAADEPEAEVVWRGDAARGVASTLATPVIQGDYLYSCGKKGRYTCMRLSDGKRLWKTYAPTTGERGSTWANAFTIKHRDRFFLFNDLGDLIIARLSPTGYEEIDRARIIEPTTPLGRRTVVWSHPAFARRAVFARNDREIVCVSLAAPADD